MKTRLIKSIFTHALYKAQNDNQQRVESFRINAIRIAARFLGPVKQKGRDEYYTLITSHLIKIMMEDERDRMRKEAVMLIEPSKKTVKYLVMKTLDVSHKVRNAVYKNLLATNYKFSEVDINGRI